MMPLLKAEFRKLFTIRSTYIILTISFLLIGFLTFWVFGYKGESAGSKLLTEAAMTAAQVLAVFLAIIAVLLMTHEYRCNTIMYTLTSSNSRHKVLLSKLLIVTVFTTAVTIVGMLFAMLMAWLGTVVGDGRLGVQYVDAWDILWRSLFFTWAYAMVGLFVSVLVRHVVGAIVVLMIVPSTIEGLLGMLLKENTKYLPFTSLDQVMIGSTWSPGKAAAIFMGYLLVGWVVAWYLFLRRDAN